MAAGKQTKKRKRDPLQDENGSAETKNDELVRKPVALATQSEELEVTAAGTGQKINSKGLVSRYAKLFGDEDSASLGFFTSALDPSQSSSSTPRQSSKVENNPSGGKSLSPNAVDESQSKEHAETTSDANNASKVDGEPSIQPKKKAKKQLKDLSEEELSARKERTLFIGNVPLDWDKKKLKQKIQEVVGDKYTGQIGPLWFRDEPLKEKYHANLRKAGSILQDYDEGSANCKTAYVLLASADAVRTVRFEVHGLQADATHILRADAVGSGSKLQKFDRKRSVFVGNLPPNTNDSDLRKAFDWAGEIDAVRIVRDKNTKCCKGIAFVLFKERKSVKPALNMWGHEILGREVRVTKVEQQEGGGKSEDSGIAHPAALRIQQRRKNRAKKAAQAGIGGVKKKTKKEKKIAQAKKAKADARKVTKKNKKGT